MSSERWQKIESIYQAAVEMHAEQRAAFLAQACGGDDALRREVETLLAGGSSMLDHPVWELFPTATVPLARPPLAPGSQLGPYEIEEPLGSGGMGEVFRARDKRLGRTVAIKVLPPDAMADPARKKRLLLEARAASALNHPNFVTLHDISSHDGIDFLVMEYIRGRTLKELLTPNGLPLRDALAYIEQAARALAVAHAAGIVHRDIKPANIMITPEGQVKLLDFGIAKLTSVAPALSGETGMLATTPGTVVGTVSYMSPEQTHGRETDSRSDIFSLGIVLYEAATAQLPFQGPSALAVMHAIAATEPVKASAIRKHLPSGLDRLLAHAMAKEPSRRFQSAAEFANEIQNLQTAQPSGLSRRQKAAGVFVLTIAALAVWWGWNGRRAPASKAPELEQVTNFAGGGGETGPSAASSPALSADGKLLAFIHDSQVWVQLLPGGEPRQLTHDESPKFDPAFSPDGARIAYSSISPNNSWDTWTIPSLGGEPRLWLPNASGLTWTGADTILFSEIKTGIHMGVVTASASRTGSRDIYIPSDIRGMAHRAFLSPNRKWVLIAEMDRGSWLPCRVTPADGSTRARWPARTAENVLRPRGLRTGNGCT